MATQIPLFEEVPLLHAGTRQALPVALNDDVQRLLAQDCVVAVGVSGGKDSVACALAVSLHLDSIGHRGPRLLIHSDLGRIEWADSLPSCERLAEHLGWELLVVQRKAGDLIARWEGRWQNNLTRYRELSCVKLILPWSTPSLRFCTSELKADILSSALRKKYPNQNILNVTGVRRQESAQRCRMPVSSKQLKLQRRNAEGVTWNAIIDWPIEQVFAAIKNAGLSLHEAYTKYLVSRVSCMFCIMSSMADLKASSQCEDNNEVFRLLVDLEARSSFGFQGQTWLADVAPHLLSSETLHRVARAKEWALERNRLEAAIPKHLLYTKGWPTQMPTLDEAALLASIRTRISDMMGLQAEFLTPKAILGRYEQLMQESVSA